MDKKKLSILIKKEEGTKLDFKQKLDLDTESGKKELAKDICAIANSRGGRGYLIIGIEDKTKRIVGIEGQNITEEQIQQIISTRIEPPIPAAFELIQYNSEKKLGVLSIYDGGQKPYQVRENGAFYIRRGSTTDTMRKQELVSAFQDNLTLNAELCPIIRSNTDCIEKSLVDMYFKSQGISVNDENRITLMKNASIIFQDRESGDYVVTLGGLLVFSKINNLYITNNFIRIVNKINREYEGVFLIYGDLNTMLDKSEEILLKVLPSGYPSDAVFEAVKNAVLYRDYTIFFKEIEVVLDYNSVSVISPGSLIEAKNVNSHNYFRRNMWIYEKMMAMDRTKRFRQQRRVFIIIKKALKNHGRFMTVNSQANNSFKTIFPGINNFK